MYLLGIEQRVVCRFEAVHANEQPGVGLVGGRDFDGVIVQVWPRLILVGSGGSRRRSPAPVTSHLENGEAEFQQLPMDSRRNPFLIFHNPRRA